MACRLPHIVAPLRMRAAGLDRLDASVWRGHPTSILIENNGRHWL